MRKPRKHPCAIADCTNLTTRERCLSHSHLVPFEDRFWPKVYKTDTCWLWTAEVAWTGYGTFRWDGRKQVAHRVAYEVLVGPIPEGLFLDHTCYIRHCVNPAHLQPVTPSRNSQNLSRPPRSNKSGVRGVCWNSQKQKWRVYAMANGVNHHGGDFEDLREAEAAAVALRNRVMTNNLLDRTYDLGQMLGEGWYGDEDGS